MHFCVAWFSLDYERTKYFCPLPSTKEHGILNSISLLLDDMLQLVFHLTIVPIATDPKLHMLFHIPQFRIKELTGAYLYLCDSDRYDLLFLALYRDVIIFTIYFGQLMMVHDVNLEDMEFGRLLVL